jgi:virulence factor Mce-like protein
MDKQALSPARLAVIVLFSASVFGLLLFLWLSFGGAIPLKPAGYRFQISFPEAASLAEQSDVRVAGVSVGKVVAKERDPAGNRTLATLELQRRYAPIRSDARAILRQKTLLGETYVELTTGTRGAAFVPEGGRLPDSRIQPTVELDELLEIFDRRTRHAFRLWQRELARAAAGRGQDLNDALGNLPGFTADGTGLLEVLDRRAGALRSQVANTGVTFAALTENEERLRTLIVSTRLVFDAIASEREDLALAIRIFPTFLDESKATLARLHTFARATDPLLVDLEPTLADLRPTLASLGRLSPDLRRLFLALDPLIDESASGLPALDDVLEGADPVLEQVEPFLGQLNPILQWLKINQQVVSDFISVGPSALANREPTPNPHGRGHVLPQLIMIGDQTLLTRTRTPSNRGNAYLEPGAFGKPKWQEQQILPNWDCVPSGGRLGPGQGEPVAGFGGRPACFLQRPIDFQDRSDHFPQVHEKHYQLKD